MSLVLYQYWRSSCSWRLRWALYEKNIVFTEVPIDLLKGEQRSMEYLKLSPSGTVPLLLRKEDGFRITDSFAALEWLEEVFPRHSLLPKDPDSRALVRSLTQIITSGTQPLQNLKVMKLARSNENEQKEWNQHWIRTGLETFEQTLRSLGIAGTYSFGGELSLADLALVPQCYNARRFGISLDDFPLIARIEKNALTRPACQKAFPSQGV